MFLQRSNRLGLCLALEFFSKQTWEIMLMWNQGFIFQARGCGILWLHSCVCLLGSDCLHIFSEIFSNSEGQMEIEQPLSEPCIFSFQVTKLIVSTRRNGCVPWIAFSLKLTYLTIFVGKKISVKNCLDQIGFREVFVGSQPMWVAPNLGSWLCLTEHKPICLPTSSVLQVFWNASCLWSEFLDLWCCYEKWREGPLWLPACFCLNYDLWPGIINQGYHSL